jgi:hypothetical protein
MATKEKEFKLPRYLRLNRGAMWFDIDGNDASGIKLYAVDTVFIGRGHAPLKDKNNQSVSMPEVPRDKYGNNNFINYGLVDAKNLPWYADTKGIPNEKLSRVILAYKHGILVEADPKIEPKKQEKPEQEKEFGFNKAGERVFIGQNKEMYKKLQGLNFDTLRDFVRSCPRNETSKNNLIDMFHYEQKGYNRLSRPRLEVLDLIREKLKEFGPSMSAIRVNEE